MSALIPSSSCRPLVVIGMIMHNLTLQLRMAIRIIMQRPPCTAAQAKICWNLSFSSEVHGLLILAIYDLEIRFHDLINLDAQSLMQFSSTEVRLDEGCKIHLSKQFSVNEFTSDVAYAVAISVAMEDLTWSLTCWVCTELNEEPVLELLLEPPKPRKDDIELNSKLCEMH
ncbi:hypothetical protein KL919_002375 [Ogataea angusta]|nr:hypothetical protein KL943_003147 [Ogataea angusta]KAG7859670.1 hypothetical protein KL919_002375 [Ogataea angusta]